MSGIGTGVRPPWPMLKLLVFWLRHDVTPYVHRSMICPSPHFRRTAESSRRTTPKKQSTTVGRSPSDVRHLHSSVPSALHWAQAVCIAAQDGNWHPMQGRRRPGRHLILMSQNDEPTPSIDARTAFPCRRCRCRAALRGVRALVKGVEKTILSKMLVEGSNKRTYALDRHAGVVCSLHAIDGPRRA